MGGVVDTGWAADRVERRKVADLRPYEANSRVHSEEQIARLAASIEEWGWTIPVLVDPEGGIIAGHGRVEAAKRLGLAEVPVMVAEGWSEERKRAYVITDNKLAEDSSWDRSILADELKALGAGGYDLGLIGFAADELDDLLLPRTPGRVDPDETPEPRPDPVAAPGDLWILGEHRLICGDSTSAEDVARLFGEARPRLMVTDPPYGVDYDPDWRNRTEDVGGFGDPEKAKAGARSTRATGKVTNDHRADWREAWALFPGDVAYVWHASPKTAIVAESLAAVGLEARALIVWGKSRIVIGRGDYHHQHETCWYVVRKGKPGGWRGGRKQSTLWSIDHRRSETGQGTQKPVEAMRRPMANNSKPGEAVYDPFCGSGTSIIAGEMEARRVLALEIDPVYCDVILRRWAEFTGREPVLESGETFAVVEAMRKAAA